MVRDFGIGMNPDVTTIVCPAIDASKRMVELSGASVIAWRSEPGPESSVFVTVTTAAARRSRDTASGVLRAIVVGESPHAERSVMDSGSMLRPTTRTRD